MSQNDITTKLLNALRALVEIARDAGPESYVEEIAQADAAIAEATMPTEVEALRACLHEERTIIATELPADRAAMRKAIAVLAQIPLTVDGVSAAIGALDQRLGAVAKYCPPSR